MPGTAPVREPVARWDDRLLREIDTLLTEAELRAVATAPLAAGAEDVIAEWVAEGRPLAVVTNNSPACVERLARRCLSALAQVPVVGRDPRHPERVKPDPWGIRQALAALGREAPAGVRSAVMVGDSLSDVSAARAAGCGFIGMGCTPAKRARLEAVVGVGTWSPTSGACACGSPEELSDRRNGRTGSPGQSPSTASASRAPTRRMDWPRER